MGILLHSPSLQAYLRELFTRSEQTVAQVLAEETATDPDGIEPQVAAVAMVGAMRALYERFLAAVGSGQGAKDTVAALPRDVERAFGLLERGLGSYATADAPTSASPRHTP